MLCANHAITPLPAPTQPLTIRRMTTEDDVAAIVTYWSNLDDKYLGYLSLPREKVPDAAVQRAQLLERLHNPPANPRTVQLMVERAGHLLGHLVLREITPGADAEIHYHMHRGQQAPTSLAATATLAADIFINAVHYIFANFDIMELRCEPLKDNPLPNRLLQKLGLRIADVITRTGGISAGLIANRYIVTRQHLSHNL